MSRVGKEPILIPAEVTVKIQERKVEVVGPKGRLELSLTPEIRAEIKEKKIFVTRQNEDRRAPALQGLTRSLLANMIEGVIQGFIKVLKLVGTGYRVKLEGEKLILSLGFSHPVEVVPPEGIKFKIEGNDTIKIEGINKQLVGQTAASIRSICPPEPYKGKGIRYEDEQVRRKPGKAGKVGGAGGEGGGIK